MTYYTSIKNFIFSTLTFILVKLNIFLIHFSLPFACLPDNLYSYFLQLNILTKELSIMRLTKEFLGSAEIYPEDDVVAASIGTWVINYTVGKYGIDDGGNLLIAWRSVSDWQLPQFDRPKALGFSTIKTSGKAKLKPEVGKKNQRPFDKAVLIRVYDGYL